MNPLLWLGVALVVLAVIGWPRYGVVATVTRLRRASERILIEDALKHLLNCELAEQPATLASVAGMLETTRARGHQVITRLGELGLALSDDRGVRLTDAGRSYALRILRTHRLLERYFADRTGLPPSQWHQVAEAEEHSLSEDEAEKLAVRMGHPPYDPHGDPIPTRAGKLPPRKGVPLGALPPGVAGTVVHVEDEPEAVYRQLRDLGINVAVPVMMVRADPNSIRVMVAGVARDLDPLAAAAVSVEAESESGGPDQTLERLDGLEPGTAAQVVQISQSIQGPQRRRLLDLGVLPGTEVTAEMRSASGDPVAYRIRGALIALRKTQAHEIFVRPLADDQSEPHQ